MIGCIRIDFHFQFESSYKCAFNFKHTVMHFWIMRFLSQLIFIHFSFDIHKTWRLVQTFVGKINEIHYYWFGWSLSHVVRSHFIRFSLSCTQKIKDNRIFQWEYLEYIQLFPKRLFTNLFTSLKLKFLKLDIIARSSLI